MQFALLCCNFRQGVIFGPTHAWMSIYANMHTAITYETNYISIQTNQIYFPPLSPVISTYHDTSIGQILKDFFSLLLRECSPFTSLVRMSFSSQDPEFLSNFAWWACSVNLQCFESSFLSRCGIDCNFLLPFQFRQLVHQFLRVLSLLCHQTLPFLCSPFFTVLSYNPNP